MGAALGVLGRFDHVEAGSGLGRNGRGASPLREASRLLRLGSLVLAGFGPFIPWRRPALLWNTTASAPLGFYRIVPPQRLAVGDWVALRPPPPLAAWLARGGYLPRGALLLKRIAAAPGESVCREGDRLVIEGRLAAYARNLDRRGRPLPAWRGCRTLREGELFLLNPAPDSLDGRYFGGSRAVDVAGLAKPLWTWRAPV